jgi:predicted ATP-grasp superfamily ATP-dependent carboligase
MDKRRDGDSYGVSVLIAALVEDQSTITEFAAHRTLRTETNKAITSSQLADFERRDRQMKSTQRNNKENITKPIGLDKLTIKFDTSFFCFFVYLFRLL